MIWPFALCLLYLNEPGYAWLRWPAMGIFALMAVSDVLDGYLARRLKDESLLGKFLDPQPIGALHEELRRALESDQETRSKGSKETS